MRLRELDAFEADALRTADELKELAAHIEGRYPGGAARCRRAASLIWEMVFAENDASRHQVTSNVSERKGEELKELAAHIGADHDHCATCGVELEGEHDCATATLWAAGRTARLNAAVRVIRECVAENGEYHYCHSDMLAALTPEGKAEDDE